MQDSSPFRRSPQHALGFDEAACGPDDDLRLAFEATSRLDDERTMVKQLIEAVLLKHEAKRWAS